MPELQKTANTIWQQLKDYSNLRDALHKIHDAYDDTVWDSVQRIEPASDLLNNVEPLLLNTPDPDTFLQNVRADLDRHHVIREEAEKAVPMMARPAVWALRELTESHRKYKRAKRNADERDLSIAARAFSEDFVRVVIHYNAMVVSAEIDFRDANGMEAYYKLKGI